MISRPLDNEMLELWSHLNEEGRQAVFDFAKGVESRVTDEGATEELVRFAGSIDAGDLALMSEAIEEGCEKVNLDEW